MRDVSTQHQQIYDILRERLVSGQFAPGSAVKARDISAELDIGLMPVRAAITRLVGERGLEVQPNGRFCVPTLTRHRFEELMQARAQLEPLCAQRALPFVTEDTLAEMEACDARVNDSYRTGDVESYMRENFQFHFTLYRCGGSEVLLPLLESVWMQFGPFMRSVFTMDEKSQIVDKHQMTLDAIRRGDATALGIAIQADIADAAHFLKQALGAAEAPPA